MERVYRRLERWRKKRRGREPIPKRLWAAAAAIAREHGINPTSKALHLEFNKLKQFVGSASPTKRTAPPPQQFLELMSSPTVSECVIELEGRHGKMRIEWKGMTTSDLAQLSRVIMEQM
jgi:transposase-like protein